MNRKTVVLLVGGLMMAAFAGGVPQDASAGLLDKLKAAKNALQHGGDKDQSTKQAQSGQQQNGQEMNEEEKKLQAQIASEPYCPPQSTVCNHHALDKLVACQSSSAGKMEHLAADRIEEKLKVSPKLNAKERAVWEADITALRAVGYKRPYKAPDPGNSMQYAEGLTKDEFAALRTTAIRYRQQVIINCERKNPNALRTAASTEQYIAGLREKMPKPYEVSSIRVGALSSPFPKTEEEIEKERQTAVAARQAKVQQLAAKCYGGTNKIRMGITADRLQEKLDSSKGLSAKERADFEADIKATRVAAAEGSSAPKPVDSKNPYRYITRLTLDDQMAINTAFQKQYITYLQKCTQQ